MKSLLLIFIVLISTHKIALADDASKWLKKEIDVILDSYKKETISKETKFLMIEKTINSNFAGTGIAKFVSGDSWSLADKEDKKKYIKLFKRHLALSIASMMQGYSNQEYKLTRNSYDSKNKVSLIDMKIYNNTGNLVVTWRVKKSKEKFYVIDLLVADISLVVAKRSEFNSILKNIDNDLKELNIVLEKQNESSFNKFIN